MNLDKLASLRRWVVLWFAVGVNFTMMGAARSIRQPIDESSLVTLSGNVHPLAAAQYDRGAADLSIPADRMLLVLKRSPQQDTDLQQFLNELHDKNSASYHKWLTPSQYGERFGAAAEDIQVLTIWLEGHGLKVVQVNPARTTIEFSGTVGQLQDTFHTAMHRYIVNGQQHVANALTRALLSWRGHAEPAGAQPVAPARSQPSASSPPGRPNPRRPSGGAVR